MSGAFDTQAVLAALGSVLGVQGAPLPLHEPDFAGTEWQYVKQCLDSGWLSSAGSFVERFERDLAQSLERRIVSLPSSARLGVRYVQA